MSLGSRAWLGDVDDPSVIIYQMAAIRLIELALAKPLYSIFALKYNLRCTSATWNPAEDTGVYHYTTDPGSLTVVETEQPPSSVYAMVSWRALSQEEMDFLDVNFDGDCSVGIHYYSFNNDKDYPNLALDTSNAFAQLFLKSEFK